jgi:hypothetical protein
MDFDFLECPGLVYGFMEVLLVPAVSFFAIFSENSDLIC